MYFAYRARALLFEIVQEHFWKTLSSLDDFDMVLVVVTDARNFGLLRLVYMGRFLYRCFS